MTRAGLPFLVACSILALAGCGGDDPSERVERKLRGVEPIELVADARDVDGRDAYDAAARVLDARLDSADVVHVIEVRADRLVVRARGLDEESITEFTSTQGLLGFYVWAPIGDTVYRSRQAARQALGARWQDVEAGDLVLVHGPPEQMQGNGVTLAGGGHYDRHLGAFAVLEDDPAITDQHVLGARAEHRDAPTEDASDFAVALGFTSEGSRRFRELTEQVAREGALRGVPERFAIVVDDEVVSVPMLDYREYPTGIISREALISGLRDADEMNDLAALLDAGPLPFPLRPRRA